MVTNGTNNCWFPLARKWPTWKWTWIWIPYGKIEKKCPRYFRRDSRGNRRDLNMCRTGRSAALSRRRKSMPPINRSSHEERVHETRNWSSNNVDLRRSTVTWMSRHYVFTVISRWSTFSSTVNFCNNNSVIFSDTHCSFGPPIMWHSPFPFPFRVCCTSKIMKMECHNLPLSTSLSVLTFQQLV